MLRTTLCAAPVALLACCFLACSGSTAPPPEGTGEPVTPDSTKLDGGGSARDASRPPGKDSGAAPGRDGGEPPEPEPTVDAGIVSDSGAPPSSGAIGCDGATRLAVNDDPSVAGPWPVGAKTVTIAGLTTEIWYPATPGSESGLTKAQYDIRQQLPDADGAKIPDSENPLQPCNCYRDLPIDASHGPYPVVVFVHGTAAFRTQSASITAHWASRGFIVLSSDHPGIRLKDILASGGLSAFGADQPGNTSKLLDALSSLTGDLQFLDGHADLQRIGLSGHSAGGRAIAGFGSRPFVSVLIPMASGGVQAGSSLTSTLVLAGLDDGIARYANSKNGYTQSPKKKRLVGLSKAGHLAFSDLCFIGRDKGGILKIAQDNGVAVPQLVSSLANDGCKPGQLAAETGWEISNYASTAVLEETLACSKTSAAALAKTKQRFADVGEFAEDL